ncbi:MAG: hypothetical protein A3F70_14630 [Acidobacteria bacterium RIFCSPLOWO2_12_FULL_67_14]|nr:MAG: hypothetical protein A3H29_10775 [Acidobacteria bacterium RIFCSPLOWO2_02_FULL_67_21]OFW36514.1 MAG: hypothetical protein A3F70_14630 [Acidobacteria bacterium RIFCSPLOWO2_12_FULL_67_14]
MDVRDGFIVGIFNYCDGWCQACAFTSRCRVCADIAEMEASLDPNLKPIVDAPVLPQEEPPPPPRWLQELLDDMNTAAAECQKEEGASEAWPRRQVLPGHERLETRANSYSVSVHAWLRTHDGFARSSDCHDPRAVIGWFHMLIPAKVARALRGLADDDPAGRTWPADHDGSAKVALVGIERSHAAWLQHVSDQVVTGGHVQDFVRELAWMRDEIDRIFPTARAFVRPGFDEPEEMAKLLAAEGV